MKRLLFRLETKFAIMLMRRCPQAFGLLYFVRHTFTKPDEEDRDE